LRSDNINAGLDKNNSIFSFNIAHSGLVGLVCQYLNRGRHPGLPVHLQGRT
jgi:hypothetical protein